MKRLATYSALLLSLALMHATEVTVTGDTEAAQWQRIYERWKTETGITNVNERIMIPLLQAKIVHPAFGIFWDEIPPPTLADESAMANVNAFIATNGWNMHNDHKLGPFAFVTNWQSIRGLPWTEIQEREFRATTHNGILYVRFAGWHYNDHGVAFNPQTNTFPGSINGFKPLADHWYAWAQRDDGLVMTQVYEGQKTGEHDPAPEPLPDAVASEPPETMKPETENKAPAQSGSR